VGRIVHRGGAVSNQWRNREAGFRSYLEAHAFRGRLHYAALRLDDEACNGRVLDEMFRENPSIAGAVTFNSTCYILAGYLAARRRDGVRLVGYDVIRRNGEMLSAGVVTALVAQRPEAQGYRAVMALCEWLVEGRAPSKVNNMPIDILLKENIPYYKNNMILNIIVFLLVVAYCIFTNKNFIMRVSKPVISKVQSLTKRNKKLN